ncbi:1,3-beta-glucan synthase subunit FKS1 [Rhizoctonia solani]|uniref:1,3-beta-glucan synthase n=1 Tax=Rhizoctonia solani TaxID=456999 RepID=A0A8H7M4S4_9AGAM|nr:1,3-beta-glucan synthase subunit FKS1 [Rhizoctonia solani]
MAYDPRQHGQHAGHGPSFPAPGSHMNRFAASTASFATEMSANSYATHGPNLSREPYPAWTPDRGVPLSKSTLFAPSHVSKLIFRREIEDIFLDLTQKFGFQRDSMRNQFDYLMNLLDSRASRMSAEQALTTVHADYIGGQHANYRKWYFAAQLDLDDAVGKTQNPGLQRLNAGHRWRQAMSGMSHYDRLRQIALWLLCWGEGGNVRFTPECMCFIFKCADDYYRSPIIKPIYRFLRDQGYETQRASLSAAKRTTRKSSAMTTLTSCSGTPSGIASIMMRDKSRLVDIPPAKRFMKFEQVDWKNSFVKTYFEKRTIFQLLVHFNRVWIIHLSFFWYYTAYNSPSIYNQSTGAPPTAAMRWSVTALGGAISTLIMILATLSEFIFLPLNWKNASHLTMRLFFLFIVLGLTAGPTVYIIFFTSSTTRSSIPLIIGIVQFFVAVTATLLFSIIPSGRLFGDRVGSKSRKYMASQTFTASYPTLSKGQRSTSILLWVLVFGCKFAESYFFLTLSFRDPIRVMVGMRVQRCGRGISEMPCVRIKPRSPWPSCSLWTCSYSSSIRTFGMSSGHRSSPSRVRLRLDRVFGRLGRKSTPHAKRIFAKLLATGDMEVKYKPKVLVSQIWNAIIISMYREHLLSIDHVQQLMYHQAEDKDGRKTLRAPLFFTAQGTREFLPPGSEAERRISFFAQSLTASFPEPISVECMPTFTVLVPHYSEKILLSLREIIREEDQNTRVTLLEYLKQLHPLEWDNFVRDTKILAEEVDVPTPDEKSGKPGKADDLPFYCIGFKSSSPEFTLRTRIWASLRAQTLYRTISGFMNYAKAIKLLYRVENPEMVQAFQGDTERLEKELERMARRKFKYCVSMQRYAKFNKVEQENAEFLLRAYPDLQIAYLDEEPGKEGSEPRVFSALIDGHSEINPETKKRTPKFRIELPGNPIIGDGKSDNQNHAVIFHRGEYLQVVDANQDNYLEECIKIRNLLGEFEEYNMSSQSPYGQGGHKEFAKDPVAILGAREYIFSENIGILGDIAAGKEQTFGTLSARALAFIGGKLHYGHPDFLHALFMTTRGGVSKAQKGLHLNEDIFAGMTAFARGGRIKHSEYYQCGKGRDQGFGTVLNFQTKLGNGMGEQLLFLTFYYGHAGFQINNILVICSIHMFVFVLLFLGTMNKQLTVCKYNSQGQMLGGQTGCYNLVPVFDWIRRCITSIFSAFFIAFLPLFLQELMDRGAGHAMMRLGRHFLSLSPIFEVFSTQIYSQALLSNLTFGGARYIATGRGFATTRTSFSILYSRFAGPSIYLGMRSLLMLLYATMSIWIPHLIYFWFSFSDFIIDYREFLRWMSRGNSRSHSNSWIGYCRLSRTQITGYKKKKLGHPSEKLSSDVPRAGWRTVLLGEIIFPSAMATMLTIAYMFVKSFPDENGNAPASPLIRIAVISLGPVVWNSVVLLVLFFISLFMGPIMKNSCPKFGATIAFIAHMLSVIGMIGFFEFLWFLELWDASHAVLGLIAVIAIQRAVHKILISIFLTREFKHDETNRAWWTGTWYGRGLGTHAMSQPAREFVVKTVELSLWSGDFVLCHFLLLILLPFTLIPFVDTLHSTMLFWLRPSKQIRAPLYSTKQKRQRRKVVIKYGLVYFLSVAIFVGLIAGPALFREYIHFNCTFCTAI